MRSITWGDYAACERVWNQMVAVDKSILPTEPRVAQLDLALPAVALGNEGM
jgi:hypothetical protein